MTLFEYIDGLTEKQLEEYADRCGTSTNYVKGHIKHATRIPKGPLLKALSRGSEGHVSHEEVLIHFGFLERPLAPGAQATA